jgi:predicted esterase
MIGFSMGGLPTMHYTQEYPKTVSKIALLAPTTRKYEWNVDNVRDILDIDIQIWHGTADVNIGIVYTDNFVSYLKDLGKTITLNRLDGKTHFDVDAEYMEEILEFFTN